MRIYLGWLSEQFPDLTYIERLDTGGSKAVFNAKHAVDGHVVLKLLRPGQEYRNEVHAMMQVTSARIPAMYDVGQIAIDGESLYWMREQRVIGPAVRKLLGQGALSPADVALLALNMLEALADVERAGIVHLDVKPENIIRGPAGDYWLTDFGNARNLTLQSQSAAAGLAGKYTSGYSPSEQWYNLEGRLEDRIDGRTDLFALGVTLYECATGVNPFLAAGATEAEILDRTRSLEVPPLSGGCAPGSSFPNLIAAMMQKRINDRPQSVAAAHACMREIYEAASGGPACVASSG